MIATLKNVTILIMCVIKDGNKFHQLFLKEALVACKLLRIW